MVPALPSLPLLFALLCGLLHGVFTLLPQSSTLVLAWPWVLVWQVAWLCPVLWLLSQGLVQTFSRDRSPRVSFWLGQGWDWVVGFSLVGLGISTVIAEFPQHARWDSTIGLCAIATLYAVTHWLRSTGLRQRVLIGQGALSLGFVGMSLGLGMHLFGRSVGLPIPLGNGFPIGSSTAVAGYLTLVIPLLAGLAIEQTGWVRVIWIAGLGLGIIDLYTTGAWGGWLGLVVALLTIGIIRAGGVRSQRSAQFQRSQQPLGWMWGGLGGAGVCALAIAGLMQNPSELATRMITLRASWSMGVGHFWTGLGLGSVPLMFQRYRPTWAGTEAELVSHLHSTPLQLWAELGVWGLGLWLGTIGALGVVWWRYRSQFSPLTHSLFVGLLAYAVQSLTDYQLDQLCISTTIVIFLAAIASTVTELSPEPLTEDSPPIPRWLQILPIVGLGLVLVIGLSLVPLYRAWMLSSQGFQALAQLEAATSPTPQRADRSAIALFTQPLSAAAAIAPWEPYYAYQLGWNLADRGLTLNHLDLITQAIPWFHQGNQASPHQEFGRSNLAWLLLNRDPEAASQEFARAAQLVPAKPGIFYGLGLSLLYQNQLDRAIFAIALEIVRHPTFMTSPLWRAPQRTLLYEQVLNRAEAIYSDLIAQSTSSSLTQFLQVRRGVLRWWNGDRVGAQADADASRSTTLQTVLALEAARSPQDLARIPNPITRSTIAAWLQPDRRNDLLTQAWTTARSQAPAPTTIAQLQQSMARSDSFETWLKQDAPTQSIRPQRRDFGRLSRHTDGPIPQDFFSLTENLGTTVLLPDLFPQVSFNPAFDRSLISFHQDLLSSLQSQPASPNSRPKQ